MDWENGPGTVFKEEDDLKLLERALKEAYTAGYIEASSFYRTEKDVVLDSAEEIEEGFQQFLEEELR